MNEALRNKLDSLKKDFSFSSRDLELISTNFNLDMYEKKMLKMLPTYIQVPSSFHSNECVTIDIGGSNLRVSRFRLLEKDVNIEEMVKVPLKDEFHNYTSGSYTLRDIFEIAINNLEKIINPSASYNLVLTFSFALSSTSKSAATVLEVSKGFNVKDVLNKELSAELNSVIKEKKLNLNIVSIINDSVATLISGKFYNSDADIALIVGTGHNACFIDRNNEIINVESAFFNSPIMLNNYDKLLFEKDIKYYETPFEILIGGKYIGWIAREIMSSIFPSKDFSYITTTTLTEILTTTPLSEEQEMLFEISKILFARSAKLIVAEINAILKYIDPNLVNLHTIIFDGSVYEKTQYFRDAITSEINIFFKDNAKKISHKLIKDASSIGAALISQ